MRLDELPKSARIEDRRGVTVARGGIGVGTIVVLGLIGWALGIDPRLLIGGAEMMSRSGGPQQQADAGSTTSSGSPSDTMGQFVAAVLGSTETVWTDIFAQAGRTYKPPTLVMFSGATQSGCGFAKSAMGPFYCPLDQKVYLDTSFFQDLEGRLGACQVGSKTCQFSQAYVIGHEIGHHVQNLLGVLPKAQQAQRAMDKPRPTVCRSALSCKPIALLASGLTEATQSGTSLNRETWTLHCRRHPPSGMIDCSDSRKVTLCPMPSPTALRHNVRGGSRPA
jgi:predicted metalloprotease